MNFKLLKIKHVGLYNSVQINKLDSNLCYNFVLLSSKAVLHHVETYSVGALLQVVYQTILFMIVQV